MKTFTFCTIADFIKGIDPLFKPQASSTGIIQVVLVPGMNKEDIAPATAMDKTIVLIAAAAVTHIKAAPMLQ